MRTILPFKWEKIEIDAWRAKVVGGWVLQTINNQSESMVFIPDPNHEWRIEPPVTQA